MKPAAGDQPPQTEVTKEAGSEGAEVHDAVQVDTVHE